MVDTDGVRRAYDEIAANYADHRSADGPGVAVLERFLEPISETARVLDAGCGQGMPVLARLSESTATAVGLDFSREQLRLATEGAPGAALTQGDMTHLPFDADAFDAVVAYWSLIHVPLEDHRAVIDEFARVLKPGGRLLCCEGTNEWSGENPDWLDTGIRMEWDIAGAETTREQLLEAGFALEDRWGLPEEWEAGESETDLEELNDEDQPWTFFAARLES